MKLDRILLEAEKQISVSEVEFSMDVFRTLRLTSINYLPGLI